jgi:hypothetical protein
VEHSRIGRLEFGIWASAAIYVVGFFSAYILGPILTKLDK